MPYYQRNILVLSCTIFLAAFSWQQIIPFLPLFLREIGATSANVMQWSYGIFFAQALASMLGQPLWGKLADVVGRKPMVIRAGLFLTGIYFGMSFCRAPWHLGVFRFLNGVLTGFIPGSFALIATNTPQELAPRYIATAQAASSVGVLIGPAVGGLLADAFGYRLSMQVSGCAVLFSTILVLLLVREPNRTQVEEHTSLLQDVRTSMRSPVLRPVMFAVIGAAIFSNAISPVLTLHLGALDGARPQWFAGLVFALPAVAFLMSAHLWSLTGERRGYERVIALGLFGAGLGGLVLAVTGRIWVFAAAYFLCGIMMAAISPSTGAIICLRVKDSFRGRAYGMQTGASWLGAVIALGMALCSSRWIGSRGVFGLVGIWLLVAAFVFRLMTVGNVKAKEESND